MYTYIYMYVCTNHTELPNLNVTDSDIDCCEVLREGYSSVHTLKVAPSQLVLGARLHLIEVHTTEVNLKQDQRSHIQRAELSTEAHMLYTCTMYCTYKY